MSLSSKLFETAFFPPSLRSGSFISPARNPESACVLMAASVTSPGSCSDPVNDRPRFGGNFQTEVKSLESINPGNLTRKHGWILLGVVPFDEDSSELALLVLPVQ